MKQLRNGAVSIVRSVESNEFDPNQQHQFYIEDPDIPLKSIIRYRIPTRLTSDSEQTITLIKINDMPRGTQPIINVVHEFAPYHGTGVA